MDVESPEDFAALGLDATDELGKLAAMVAYKRKYGGDTEKQSLRYILFLPMPDVITVIMNYMRTQPDYSSALDKLREMTDEWADHPEDVMNRPEFSGVLDKKAHSTDARQLQLAVLTLYKRLSYMAACFKVGKSTPAASNNLDVLREVALIHLNM